jgi:O-antigen ligase
MERLGAWDIYRDIFGYGAWYWKNRSIVVHNLYLLVASDTGIIGLLVFLAFVFRALRLAHRAITQTEDLWIKSIGIGILGGYLGVLVHSLLAWTYTQDVVLMMFWFLAGLLVAANRIIRTAHNTTPGNDVLEPAQGG